MKVINKNDVAGSLQLFNEQLKKVLTVFFRYTIFFRPCASRTKFPSTLYKKCIGFGC